jgi:urea transporter
MYAPPPWLITVGAILTAVAAAGALYAWPWSRDRRRIVVATIAAVVAFLIWRGALIIANGANLDIDYPLLLGLSFEDIGTGIMAFVFAALALGLGIDRAEPARRVVTSAGLVGAAAILVDRFV